MQTIPRLTNAEMSVAYREVVERCLVIFFLRDEAHAKTLVDDWWARLTSHKGAFRSGLFLHSPAIQTAGDLAKVKEYLLTDDNWHTYESLIQEASLKAVAHRRNRTKPAPSGITNLRKTDRQAEALKSTTPVRRIKTGTTHRQQKIVA
jgi:hypothetical protein